MMARVLTPLDASSVGGSTQKLDLQVGLQPKPNASAAAREALEVFAGILPERAFADLRVIVTELVTNGVKYGPGTAIALSVSLDSDGLIRGDVDDGGVGGVHMRTPGPLGGGLGLVIVDALATWGVHPDSSHVWFEYDAAVA